MAEKLTELCTCDDFADDPCPRHERENELQNEVIRLRADAQALADVRTLDDWAMADCGTREWKMLPTNEDTCVFLRSGMSSEIVCFERGATPDEARAKAAAWVRSRPEQQVASRREQAIPAGDGDREGTWRSER